MSINDLIQKQCRIIGAIIEVERLNCPHTLEVLVSELRKVDAEIELYTAQMRKKCRNLFNKIIERRNYV